MTISTIAATDFANQRKQTPHEPVALIDVRSPAEFRSCHIAFAKNVPLDQLAAQSFVSDYSPEFRLYVICQSGKRSQRACEQLSSSGFQNVFSIDGGMQACEQTDLPIETGRPVISLERQVRISAGFLILLGGLLAYFVHPLAIGLSMFVGAGLVFAGITDTCGMGMLLARMPWNR